MNHGNHGLVKIIVVGDVHEAWEPQDALALEALQPDLVLFVGDFGNESVSVVRQIAALDLPKAVILGNHDAWYSASPWGRSKCPYDRRQEDRVQQQLDLLGPSHVGFGKLDFPGLNLTVVGARPYSFGGSEWKNQDFYRDRCSVSGFEDSAARIIASAKSAACEHLILLGHCGPKGLGSAPEDICGKDWDRDPADHGDPDQTLAIAEIQRLGWSLPLVTFGHMHHHLRHRRDRLRTHVVTDPAGTVYFNAAYVPRIEPTEPGVRRLFPCVTLDPAQSMRVVHTELLWV
jgi:uncharacterized protein (TIGR04168 family)